ncbi:hypothetical protein [Dokdonia sp.]|uniref:hypothetical protein n=1 Tax=Dokdonia sp. TaxID=2024995 RepID=UPI003266A78D
MNRIIIKVTHEDRGIHGIAIELYLHTVGNLLIANNTAIYHMQYSLLWCYHHKLKKYFNLREPPLISTLKLDPHDAITLRDSLLYLMNNSIHPKEKASATRLYIQIDSLLSNDDKDRYLLP